MRELIHIYGPFSIYSYGVAIAIGLLMFMWLMQQHPQFKKLNLAQHFASIMSIGVLAGFVGGRLLEILSTPEGSLNFSNFFEFWKGGFSILGTIICVLITLPIYLHYANIPIVPFLDLVAINAGILQSIARTGCFFAGCCYGIPTKVAWAVCYTDPNTSAPLGILMHPTQLYSSAIFFGIFLLMYFVLQYKLTKPGQLASIYLMFASSERFFVDFLRANRVFVSIKAWSIFSINQWVALGIFTSATIAFIFFTLYKSKT